jgi:hypothetical protein
MSKHYISSYYKFLNSLVFLGKLVSKQTYIYKCHTPYYDNFGCLYLMGYDMGLSKAVGMTP